MKYLKEFENSNLKYKVGDYVLIKSTMILSRNKLYVKSKEYVHTHIGKIVHIVTVNTSDYLNDMNDVKIEYVDVPKKIQCFFEKGMYQTYKYEDIERFATPEEIEEYELKVLTNKFNM